MKNHTCPHCNEAVFTPLDKALLGSLRTNGKPCPNCGRKCCNSMTSIYVATAISILSFVCCMLAYLFVDSKTSAALLILLCLVIRFAVTFLYDMFFGNIVEPIRVME